jgi:transposase
MGGTNIMLAELVDHVIGIDPDKDWITAAIIEAETTRFIESARFSADRDGYARAVAWADGHTTPGERVWAIEGSAGFGRGLTAALSRADEWVIEFDWARHKATKDAAKSDELDAIQAAREVLGRERLNTPRTHEGQREALRVHTVARAGAVRARTAAINELKALVVTADDDLRAELRNLTTRALVSTCGSFRSSRARSVTQQCTRLTMRALAQRIAHLNTEIADHDRAMTTLLRQVAPQLLDEAGIGHVTAAAFYIAWSHPGRCRNEAAYARLGGVAPLPATSGQQQTRHRLNRHGDRDLNHALYIVAMTRSRCHPDTIAYRARRRAEGRTDREITRCVKRYIARQVWRLLEHPTGPEIPT